MGDSETGSGGAAIQQAIVDNIRAQLRRQLGQEPPPALLQQVVAGFMAKMQTAVAAKPKLTREEAQQYWMAPADAANKPEAYLNADPRRGELLLKLLDSCQLNDPSILEIGCNAGRNLECLRRAGYPKLAGIEINQGAVDLLGSNYRELAETASLTVSPVEDAIIGLMDSSIDVIFSMAVLVHIHPDSDWVFSQLARVAKHNIITIEDERNDTERHFKRNYQEVFEALGFSQLSERDCKDAPGLDGAYTARVFKKDA